MASHSNRPCQHPYPTLFLCLEPTCMTPVSCEDCFMAFHKHGDELKWRDLTPSEKMAYEFQELIADRVALQEAVKQAYTKQRQECLRRLQERQKRNLEDLDRILSKSELESLSQKYQSLFAVDRTLRSNWSGSEMLVEDQTGLAQDEEGIIQPNRDKFTVGRRLKEYRNTVLGCLDGALIKQESGEPLDSQRRVIPRIKTTKATPINLQQQPTVGVNGQQSPSYGSNNTVETFNKRANPTKLPPKW